MLVFVFVIGFVGPEPSLLSPADWRFFFSFFVFLSFFFFLSELAGGLGGPGESLSLDLDRSRGSSLLAGLRGGKSGGIAGGSPLG